MTQSAIVPPSNKLEEPQAKIVAGHIVGALYVETIPHCLFIASHSIVKKATIEVTLGAITLAGLFSAHHWALSACTLTAQVKLLWRNMTTGTQCVVEDTQGRYCFTVYKSFKTFVKETKELCSLCNKMFHSCLYEFLFWTAKYYISSNKISLVVQK